MPAAFLDPWFSCRRKVPAPPSLPPSAHPRAHPTPHPLYPCQWCAQQYRPTPHVPPPSGTPWPPGTTHSCSALAVAWQPYPTPRTSCDACWPSQLAAASPSRTWWRTPCSPHYDAGGRGPLRGTGARRDVTATPRTVARCDFLSSRLQASRNACIAHLTRADAAVLCDLPTVRC
jgi:hypothetical protein